MKYMGSKRLLLQNGLGTLIKKEAPKYDRFVDLFAGASFVAWFVAQETDVSVVAVDLQRYSSILADAVLSRTDSFKDRTFIGAWIIDAYNECSQSPLWKSAVKLEVNRFTQAMVKECRMLCETKSSIGPVWNAYGGHYFSPTQSLFIDYLLKHLPIDQGERKVCLAALIITASKCVASPGHTAQPFQPTRTAKKYLREAWNRDILSTLRTELNELIQKKSNIKGRTVVSDAHLYANRLRKTDLVFIDPPYSGVQYSRFYHVLETIARGKVKSKIEGVGRYPAIKERPQSKFSNVGESEKAFDKLLQKISKKKSTVIVTFPSGDASNGLSGDKVQAIARKWFVVKKKIVKGRFSTLGGNNSIRDARQESTELILLLKPKPKSP
jgi:adenine-specific DNA-methyltransferase